MRTKTASLCIALALGIATAAFAGPVNVNTADVKTLAKELDGVGLERAKAIVAYRDKHGPFRTAEDLKKVQGVGAAIIEKNRGNILVDDKGAKPKLGAGG